MRTKLRRTLVRSMPPGELGDQPRRPSPEPTGEKPVAFHLATIQSIARNAGKKVDAFESHGHEISLVVIDEAHISCPKVQGGTGGFCFHKGRRLLGLSATPGRGANRAEENAALARFFHQNWSNDSTAPARRPCRFFSRKAFWRNPLISRWKSNGLKS